MAESDINIKKIEEGGDNSRFSGLFFTCFKQKKDAAFFDWRYFKNPAGHIVGYEAVHKGKTVGSYGLIPEYYVIKGEKAIFYNAADAMVSPRYWGKKLFEQFAQKAQDEAVKKNEKTFGIGFPGGLSYNEFIKNLDWQIVHTQCRYVFVPRPFFQLKRLFTPTSKLQICTFPSMDSTLEAYLSAWSPHTLVSKYIDASIFQWKIFDNQFHPYKVIGIKKDSELLGVCVYRQDTPKSCELTWVHFKDKKLYKHLPVFLDSIFTESSVKYIQTWQPFDKMMLKAYKKAGFLRNPFSFGPFRDSFPFIVHKKGNESFTEVLKKENYDLQPIMLD